MESWRLEGVQATLIFSGSVQRVDEEKGREPWVEASDYALAWAEEIDDAFASVEGSDSVWATRCPSSGYDADPYALCHCECLPCPHGSKGCLRCRRDLAQSTPPLRPPAPMSGSWGQCLEE